MLVNQLKMKQNNKKVNFLLILIGTICASLLGRLLAGKEVILSGKGTITTGLDF